jgi:hypothetical protein
VRGFLEKVQHSPTATFGANPKIFARKIGTNKINGGDPVSEARYFIEQALRNLETLKLEMPQSYWKYVALSNSNS